MCRVPTHRPCEAPPRGYGSSGRLQRRRKFQLMENQGRRAPTASQNACWRFPSARCHVSSARCRIPSARACNAGWSLFPLGGKLHAGFVQEVPHDSDSREQKATENALHVGSGEAIEERSNASRQHHGNVPFDRDHGAFFALAFFQIEIHNDEMAKKIPMKVVYRDSRTGLFVTEDYATKHPATTEREHVPISNPKQ